MCKNSYKTAISRKKLSTPMEWLRSNCYFGEALDYGCGKGSDADILNSRGYVVEKFDPHFFPAPPTQKNYYTITCLYVLNTLPTVAERQAVIDAVRNLLTPHGKAYFAIRADRKALKGRTKTGSWQGYTPNELLKSGGELIHKTSGYEIYAIK